MADLLGYDGGLDSGYIDGLLWLPRGIVERDHLECVVTKRGSRRDPDKTVIDLTVTDPKRKAVGFPRNALPKYRQYCKDLRTDGEPAEWKMKTKPWKYQVPALEPLLREAPLDGATLIGACGSGKTSILLRAAQRIGRVALTTVHTSDLLTDWLEALVDHTTLRVNLDRPGHKDDIAIVRGPFRESWMKAKFLIAMIQSLSAHEYPREFYRRVGLLINDEAHRMPAHTWKDAPGRFPARRRLGATATNRRADGMYKVFELHMGKVAYKIPRGETQLRPRVFTVETDITVNPWDVFDWRKKHRLNTTDEETRWEVATSADNTDDSRLEKALAENAERNDFIAERIAEAAQNGRRILLLARFTQRLEELHARLQRMGVDSVLYTAKHAGNFKRRRALRGHQVLLGTVGIASTGINIPTLDFLALTSPDYGSTFVEQASGRVARVWPNKLEPIILNFSDPLVPRSAQCAAIREEHFERLGYPVHLWEPDAPAPEPVEPPARTVSTLCPPARPRAATPPKWPWE